MIEYNSKNVGISTEGIILNLELNVEETVFCRQTEET